ncbi:OLC1v1035351C1 [Oldenlandia corymbosa var. corymbosa]|uniref:OLC1v1035351C1 n=1 Tax=Oldenlandia corymbosa var. corymbosa TaxID=529605 RepID=A0AAV1CSV3_OLDCO|nr:OLC1v1035351C1 [Oldenlandia corymbosa var. corymbosa]
MTVELQSHPIPLPVWPSRSGWRKSQLKPSKIFSHELKIRLWDEHQNRPDGAVVECPMSSKLSQISSRYGKQWYNLFLMFDKGSKINMEGWFSITLEAVAKHLARHCCRTNGDGTIRDCIIRVGGNMIQLTQTKC